MFDDLPSIGLPTDNDDQRFIKAFDIRDNESAKSFFDEYGFVVFKDIFDEVTKCPRSLLATCFIHHKF